MYAAWGTIVFDLLTTPVSLRGSAAYDFAKQKPVLARPRLQWIGRDLEELDLGLLFHASFCDPQAQMDALRAAAAAHRAAALVFGNGIHRGYYVITKIGESPIKQAADGTLIGVSAEVTFTECPKGASASAPASAPLAISSPWRSGLQLPAPTVSVSALSPSGTLPANSVLELGSLPLGTYSPAFTSAPGTSAIGSMATSPGATAPQLPAANVPVSFVVRAQ
jgi:phage protein U